MSVMVALVALVILILSLAFIITSQPSDNADVQNVIDPFSQFPQSDSNDNDFITYTAVSDSDDDDDGTTDPEISLPDITLTHGQVFTMDLDSYSSDEEDSHSDLNFDITYNPTFIPAPITLSFNDATNVLTISEVNGTWTGTQAITIEVEDTDDDTDIDSFTVTISGSTPSTPGSPIVSGLPDIAFGEEGTDNTLDLDDYVTDSDHTDSELIWTFSGNSNINIVIGAANIVSFTSPTIDWTGAELITFTAEDPLGNTDSDTMLVTVTPVDDSAIWTALTNQNIDEDSADTIIYTDIASQCSDADDSTPTITVVSTPSAFTLTLVGNDLEISSLEANWYGTETIVMDCNGVTTNFDLTINKLLDDCTKICSYGTCYTNYCD